MKNSYFAMSDPTGFSTFFHRKCVTKNLNFFLKILNLIIHSQFDTRQLFPLTHKF